MTETHSCGDFFTGSKPCKLADQDAALKLLSRSLLSRVSDWCVIEVATAPALVEHRDPVMTKAFAGAELSRGGDGNGPKREILARDAVGVLKARGVAPERLEMVQRLGTEWYFSFPLSAHNRNYGTVSCGGAQTLFPGEEAIHKLQPYFDCIGATLRMCALDSEAEMMFRNRLEDEKTMASTIHDLKNDLHVILMSQSLLADEMNKSTLSPMTQKHLERMGRSAQRMDELFKTILEDSSYSRDNRVKEFSSLELGLVLREAIEVVAPIAEARHVEVALGGIDGALFIQGIKAQLMRVVTNLLKNAIAFSPDGSKVGVRVEECAPEGEVKISVCDSGKGLSAEAHQNIFNPGWVAPVGAPGSAEGGHGHCGYGIGLQNAKTFVEQMGGRIWVEPAKGQEGSCFSFTLSLSLAQ